MRHILSTPLRVLLLLLLFCGSVSGQAGIRFESGSFQDALAKAARENKRVFVDAYADWCGPCKWMAKTAFPDSAVGAFFNRHFVSLQIDMEGSEGAAFRENHRVAAYPTLFFLDSKGEVLRQAVGAKDAQGLLQLAHAVLRAVDPQNPDLPPVVFSGLEPAAAFAEAKATNKLVLVYKTQRWAGIPMFDNEKATFFAPEVQQRLQRDFVCLEAYAYDDRDSSLMRAHDLPRAPGAYLIFRPDSSLVECWFAALDAPGLLAMLDRAQHHPAETFAAKRARFRTGDHSDTLLHTLLMTAYEADAWEEAALAMLAARMRGQGLRDPLRWEVFQRYRIHCGAAVYDEIIPLLPGLEAQHGKAAIVAELLRWRQDALDAFGMTEDPATFTPHIQRLMTLARSYPQLRCEAAFLRMQQAYFSVYEDAHYRDSSYHHAQQLLRLDCSAADAEAIADIIDTAPVEGKARSPHLAAGLRLIDEVLERHTCYTALEKRALLLHALRDPRAKKAYQTAKAWAQAHGDDDFWLEDGFGVVKEY